MASIREIARLTNVSPATVSKVINGRPGVNAQTAQIVRQALESTNYQPVSKAIDWNRILVIVPDYPSVLTKITYISTILLGVTEQALEMGMAVSVKKLPDNINTVADMKQMLLQDGSSGIILLALNNCYQFADLLGVEKLPHVVIGDTVHENEVNQIILDETESAARAMSFLIEQGHKRIAVMLGDRNGIGHIQRLHACQQTMQKMLGDQGTLHESYCLSPNIEPGRQAFAELCKLPDPPTAVFCFNHPVAIGAIQEAQNRGIQIPEQLSLVSYVNEGVPPFIDVPLTSLKVPTYEMGRQAVTMLRNQLSGETSSNILPGHQTTLMLKIQWILGATTKPTHHATARILPQTLMEPSTA